MLHSDACLGGFVLPFARRLGYNIPAFDFSVPGVTSMSVDTHKFGMAHKGTSVVLYRNSAIRRHQYTQITEWSGGLYISPGAHPWTLQCCLALVSLWPVSCGWVGIVAHLWASGDHLKRLSITMVGVQALRGADQEH